MTVLQDVADQQADLEHARDSGDRERRHRANRAAQAILAPLRDIQDNRAGDRRDIFDHIAYVLTPGALSELIQDLTEADERRSPKGDPRPSGTHLGLEFA